MSKELIIISVIVGLALIITFLAHLFVKKVGSKVSKLTSSIGSEINQAGLRVEDSSVDVSKSVQTELVDTLNKIASFKKEAEQEVIKSIQKIV